MRNNILLVLMGIIIVIGIVNATNPPIAQQSITINNIENVSTSPNFTMEFTYNGLANNTLLNGNASNVYFQYANGTGIPSWFEGNQSNFSQNQSFNTSTTLVWWLNLTNGTNPSIPADSAIVIDMEFGNMSTNYYFGFPNMVGEAPQIWCSSGCAATTYGEYDNGAYVFPVYYNFITQPSTWTNTTSGVTYNDGLTVNFGSWAATTESGNYVYGSTQGNYTLDMLAYYNATQSGGTSWYDYGFIDESGFYNQGNKIAMAYSGVQIGGSYNTYYTQNYSQGTGVYGQVDIPLYTGGMTWATSIFAQSSQSATFYTNYLNPVTVTNTTLPSSGTSLHIGYENNQGAGTANIPPAIIYVADVRATPPNNVMPFLPWQIPVVTVSTNTSQIGFGGTGYVNSSTVGNSPFTYQWYNYTSGMPVLISGATEQNLTVAGLTSGIFFYYVTVTDAEGYAVNSSNVSITVEPQLFANITVDNPSFGFNQKTNLTANVSGGYLNFTATLFHTIPNYNSSSSAQGNVYGIVNNKLYYMELYGNGNGGSGQIGYINLTTNTLVPILNNTGLAAWQGFIDPVQPNLIYFAGQNCSAGLANACESVVGQINTTNNSVITVDNPNSNNANEFFGITYDAQNNSIIAGQVWNYGADVGGAGQLMVIPLTNNAWLNASNWTEVYQSPNQEQWMGITELNGTFYAETGKENYGSQIIESNGTNLSNWTTVLSYNPEYAYQMQVINTGNGLMFFGSNATTGLLDINTYNLTTNTWSVTNTGITLTSSTVFDVIKGYWNPISNKVIFELGVQGSSGTTTLYEVNVNGSGLTELQTGMTGGGIPTIATSVYSNVTSVNGTTYLFNSISAFTDSDTPVIYGVIPGVYSYQWLSGTYASCASNTPIAGATSQTLEINVSAGIYYCVEATDNLPTSVYSGTVTANVALNITVLDALNGSQVTNLSAASGFFNVYFPTANVTILENGTTLGFTNATNLLNGQFNEIYFETGSGVPIITSGNTQVYSSLGTSSNYLFVNTATNGQTINISLYNSTPTYGIGSFATSTISSSVIQTPADVQVYQINPNTGMPILVNYIQTQATGSVALQLANGYTYTFEIFGVNSNQLLGTISNQYESCPSSSVCTLQLLIPSTQSVVYQGITNITYSCNFNATTLNLQCSANDPSSTATGFNFNVNESGVLGDTVICQDYEAGYTAILNCTLPNNSSTYFGNLYVNYGSEQLFITSISVNGNNSPYNSPFGITGYIIAALVVIALFFMAFKNIYAAVIFTALGIVATWSIGFVGFSMFLLAEMVGEIIVMFWRMK